MVLETTVTVRWLGLLSTRLLSSRLGIFSDGKISRMRSFPICLLCSASYFTFSVTAGCGLLICTDGHPLQVRAETAFAKRLFSRINAMLLACPILANIRASHAPHGTGERSEPMVDGPSPTSYILSSCLSQQRYYWTNDSLDYQINDK